MSGKANAYSNFVFSCDSKSVNLQKVISSLSFNIYICFMEKFPVMHVDKNLLKVNSLVWYVQSFLCLLILPSRGCQHAVEAIMLGKLCPLGDFSCKSYSLEICRFWVVCQFEHEVLWTRTEGLEWERNWHLYVWWKEASLKGSVHMPLSMVFLWAVLSKKGYIMCSFASLLKRNSD